MAIVLVTGASSGIGLATAVTLARGGHKIIATMRNLDGASELQKIVSAEKLPITMAKLNVDDDASVNSAVGKALSENGSIDVLVNNAGIGGGGSVEEVPLERFREVMETNFFGALRCIKAVIPGMRERRHGCIVNITSVAGGGSGSASSLRRVQVGFRGVERVPCAGDEGVQRACSDHRTRRYRYSNIRQRKAGAQR
jgi:NAD(P)-dependent dehydrogenase (short-subunit alcohol dehydrogenase family)